MEIWIFKKWELKWLKVLIYKGFDDKGYDNMFLRWKVAERLINREFEGGLGVKISSSYVNEAAKGYF